MYEARFCFEINKSDTRVDDKLVAMEEQHESKPSLSLSSPARFGGTKKEEEEEDEQKLSHKSEEKAKAKAKARESYSPFFGKHRMAASITYLQNQINILQEELNEMETIDSSSFVCKEIISSVETIPDPLLPITTSPADVNWDRWFRGSQNSRSNKRWI